ncbi:menaquinol-cytochrome c reductase cytochrome b subunit [Aquihabitans sp. G128]|uniref:menaquinol-cytochrome c reductase cytochrome b subunit n=1 Tax=Aquihabitans sp. G128 TaxID=2849779 RepID=UPI001C241DC7|nr:menaquinol-cytochrome c reductase cytochrome b subunit [Aquihabitans sp. G128]QXC60165.1 menaquinol-cytochrome c reductase cytochrome b subunit [Aquihabitans sp. G128]
MTEIPEHLRKRAEEARAKAAAAKAEPEAPAADAAPSEAESKIPAHLLERAKAARSKAAGAEAGAGESVTAAPAGGTAVATAAPPVAAGPGGHTQRLLTVVKSGSIQDVKAAPQDKVHVWPHLLSIEFVAALLCIGFVLIFSIFVNAPLLELADINKTPNPSKAPWYFLGLQEMLSMFHPMVAGVLLPGIGMGGLMLAPYIDKNPSNKPEDRKFAISLFTIFMMSCAVLTIIGSFFRGPGQLFVFPWAAGLFFEL